jgi:hypothetical protein
MCWEAATENTGLEELLAHPPGGFRSGRVRTRVLSCFLPCVRAQLPPKGNLPSAPAPISWVLIYVLMSASQLGAPPTHSYSWRCAPVTSGARVSNDTCEWLSTLLYLPKFAAAHMFIRPSADLVMPGVVLSAPL